MWISSALCPRHTVPLILTVQPRTAQHLSSLLSPSSLPMKSSPSLVVTLRYLVQTFLLDAPRATVNLVASCKRLWAITGVTLDLRSVHPHCFMNFCLLSHRWMDCCTDRAAFWSLPRRCCMLCTDIPDRPSVAGEGDSGNLSADPAVEELDARADRGSCVWFPTAALQPTRHMAHFCRLCQYRSATQSHASKQNTACS